MTAITDNAALSCLGSLIEGFDDIAKYMRVAGAIAMGELSVIAANAPSPTDVARLKHGFNDESIGAGQLLGALLPTAIAAFIFLFS